MNARVAPADRLYVALGLWLYAAGWAFNVLAQPVATVVSDGAPVGTVVESVNNPFATTYKIYGGTQHGANLFHSFNQFGLNFSDIASFDQTPNGDVAFVIGRVTGGDESVINGRIELAPQGGFTPNASLLLVNPSGVLIGPGAEIAVPGAFAASTAQRINFPDSQSFDATLHTAPAPFTADPPESFGFLSPTPSSVTLEFATLDMGGADLWLAGGKTNLSFSNVANAGSVDAVAVASPATLSIRAGDSLSLTPESRGEVQIGPFTSIGIAGDVGSIRVVGDSVSVNASQLVGTRLAGQPNAVEIDANSLSVVGSFLSTQATAGINGPTGPVILRAKDDVNLNISFLTTENVSGGDAGDIVVEGSSIRGTSALLQSRTTGSHAAGNIRVEADRSSGSVVFEFGSSAFTETSGSGNAGQILFSGNDLLIENSGVSSESEGDGFAGSITFDFEDEVRLHIGALIQSDADSAGRAGPILVKGRVVEIVDVAELRANASGTSERGAGATIEVNASERISLSRFASVSSEARGPAKAGGVNLKAPLVQISDHAQVTTSTRGSGDGGTVHIRTDRIEIRNLGLISSSAIEGGGRGGDIIVRAKDGTVRLVGDGTFGQALTGLTAQTSSEFETGTGGRIDIEADQLLLTDGAEINAKTFGPARGGDLLLNIRDIEIRSGGQLDASTEGSGRGGNLVAKATRMLLSGDGAHLRTTTGVVVRSERDATGRGGQLKITVDELTVQDNAVIDASTRGQGDGGDAEVNANSLHLIGDGRFGWTLTGIVAQSTGSAIGDGGNLVLRGQKLVMEDGAEINVKTFGAGDAGKMLIDFEDIEIRNGAQIDGSTTASGQGGAVELRGDSVLISADDALGRTRTGILTSAESGSSGAAGDVNVVADSLVIENGGVITTRTLGVGRGGKITVSTQDLIIRSGGGITATTSSIGPGGTVELNASGSFQLEGVDSSGRPSTVSTTSTATGADSGNAGTVSISAHRAEIGGRARVSSDAIDGQGGEISLMSAGPVRIVNGRLTTVTTGAGNAGDLVLESESVSIRDGGSVEASTSNSGRGGNITIMATDFVENRGQDELGNRSIISTASTSSDHNAGTAGDIRITASNVTLAHGGRITTEATVADGGDIKLDVTGTVLLDRAQITTSVGSGVGRGGNIDIDPEFVILISSLIQANAFGGPGGNIRIVTSNFFSDEFSVVEASSTQSIDGTVEIRAPDTALGESLVVLPSEFVDVASQLAARCAARGARVAGSFVGLGRGGLPASPDGPMSAYFSAGTSIGGADADGDVATRPTISEDGAIVGEGEMGRLAPLVGRRGFVPATLALECDGEFNKRS